jgi:hypothetical protein
VYQSTPSVVYVGYLPGYVGVYPYYGSVVYGTGYYYPPYIGPVHCYPYPATFGAHVTWNPWGGFGIGVSWGTPFFSVGIHFGGYNRFYGPVGYRAPARPAYGYRPPPAGYRRAYSAGARDAYAAQARASGGNLYDRPGNAQRNVSQAQPAARRAPAASAQPNNVYGDRNGNVYRQNQGGGWERNTAGGWQQAGGAQARSASGGGAPAGLSADAAARSRASGAAHGGGGARGAGGARGGGGGGRGGGRR